MAEPFVSEIRLFSFDFAPRGWASCDGQLLQIAQNQSLFSLLGTMYGGDGRTTFALPDLRGRAALHFDSGFRQGEIGGSETVTLTVPQMPDHNHTFHGVAENGTDRDPTGRLLATDSASDNFYGLPSNPQILNSTSISNIGGNQPHDNMQPYLVLNYCISMMGIFPSRN